MNFTSALCREVTRQLFAKVPSVHFEPKIEHSFGRYTRFMTTGADRNKDRFKN